MKHKQEFLPILNALILIVLLVGGAYYVGKVNGLKNEKKITFTQTVEKTVMPDLAIVNFAIVSEGKDLNQTIEENKALNEKLMNALKDYKVETTNFYVDENKRWNFTTQQYDVLGYYVRNSIKVKCDPDDLGKVVELGLENGANRVDSIRYDLKDETKAEIKNQLLQEAIKKAIDKANIIAKASGKQLVDIVKIQPQDANIFPIYRALAGEKASGSGFEFKPEEQKVSYSVYVEFLMK